VERPVHRASRLAAALATAALAGLTCTGCHVRSQETLVPTFQPAYITNLAVHERVRAACDHLPGVHAEPLGKQVAYDVVFNVSSATTRQVSALYDCLSRQPSVLDVQQNSTDDGE
jgi:hypothetical protein